MRVFLPLPKSGRIESSDNNANTSVEEEESIFEEEVEVVGTKSLPFLVAETVLVPVVTTAVVVESPLEKVPAELVEKFPSKRLRIDSKPSARPTESMAGPQKQDVDEEKETSATPQCNNAVLENEPPSMQRRNNNYAAAGATSVIVASTSHFAEEFSFTDKSSPESTQEEVGHDDDDDGGDVTAFATMLKSHGLEIVEQEGDGNCLFRAVALQVYGDSSMHHDVRAQCLDFMIYDQSHFAQFVEGNFIQYIKRKRIDGVHGNNPEIQAISELFNRPVEVFTPETGAYPLNIFHAEYKTSDTPIRLSYHDGNHYNAVIDPLMPTAGLGLGLPGLQPGLADKMQMAKAVVESDQIADDVELTRVLKESEDDEVQRALKESYYTMDQIYENKVMKLSDLDATNLEIEQAILCSSLESYSRQDNNSKKQASSTSAATCRRRRAAARASLDLPAVGESSTGVAAIPNTAAAASAQPAAATIAAVAASPASACSPAFSSVYDYPQTVQELVMNGFDLRKVVRAYELVGDNFDSMLSFLMSANNSA